MRNLNDLDVLVVSEDSTVKALFEAFIKMINSSNTVKFVESEKEFNKNFTENAQLMNLVIIDFDMPRIDPEELIMKIKPFKSVKIVLMCNGEKRVMKKMEEMAEKFLDYGIVCFEKYQLFEFEPFEKEIEKLFK